MTIASALLYGLAATAVQTAPPQDAPSAPQSAADPVDLGEIVVSGAGLRGAVQSDIQPDITLNEEQIKAYGASNIAELLTALAPQTQSNRGRGGGSPVLLVNGRRISGFQEIRGIPTEAIERVDILPEEVALSYGYAADQRVVNFVLKAQFRSVTAQATLTSPSQGGRLTTDAEANFLRIHEGDRWTLDVEAEHDTPLYESERDIVRSPDDAPFDRIGNVTGSPYGTEIDPALSAQAGSTVLVAPAPSGAGPFGIGDFTGPVRSGDLTDFRTLLPRSDSESVSGAFSHDLNATTKATVSASLEDASTSSYLGLPGAVLTLPGGNSYSPFSDDVLVHRYLDRPDALGRKSDVLTAKVGMVLDGFLGDDWRWTATGGYDRVESDTRTGRGINASGFQSQLNANNPSANPFGDLPQDQFATIDADTARSVSSGANAELVLSGKNFDFAAGQLASTFQFGADTTTLESESVRLGVASERSLSRDRYDAQGSFTLPISDRDRGVRTYLGDLSVNLNLGYEEISDFSGLPTLGFGANWSPIEPLSFIVSYTDEQGAPTIQQLNDPTISTPDTPVFDFATGQTVNITRVTGGNPNLSADNRRVLKVGVNLRPFSEQDLRFSSDYTRSSIDDDITAFPTFTPDLEAALPERFTRDSMGQLISIDARPLNYTRSERQELRTGFNFSRAFGKPTPPSERAAGPGGRPGAAAVFGGGGGRGGRGGRGGMQPGQGRFNISIYDTWHIQDEIVIRDGLPVIDLLDGGATGGQGGQPRHEVQAQLGVFRNGFGAFVNSSWKSSTRVDGGATGSDLLFSDQATVNLNLFADLSARENLVERFGWLKGARINLGIQNLFDSRLEVRSESGDTPLNYQPDYLDPLGRVISISFRKILF